MAKAKKEKTDVDLPDTVEEELEVKTEEVVAEVKETEVAPAPPPEPAPVVLPPGIKVVKKKKSKIVQ